MKANSESHVGRFKIRLFPTVASLIAAFLVLASSGATVAAETTEGSQEAASKKQSQAPQQESNTTIGSSLTKAFRLDAGVRPVRYDIHLTPDFDTMTFSGEEEIQITLAEPTRRIVLHAFELEVQEATVKRGWRKLRADISLDKDSQTLTLELPKQLKAGNASVKLSFSGRINTRLAGLHGEIVEGERYAVTELEPDGARRVIPCFDEPAFKAVFGLTLTLDSSLEAIGNGPIDSVSEEPKGGMKTVHFADSPIMSSYLLTLAFGDFVVSRATSSNGTPTAVWSLKSKAKFHPYTLDTMTGVLPVLEKKFGIPYPYPKLDLIVVPQYGGAMENMAAMIFGEFGLVDPEKATRGRLRGLTDTIIHEIAHQWVGDLVTNAWWDDLWLNEAFANWITSRILEAWKPEWKPDLDDIIGARNWVMVMDSRTSTHPIRSPVRTAEDADDMFDGITYVKGQLVLSWLEEYVGSETFWTGIRAYLEAHRDGVASSEDLWSALEEVSKQPIQAIAQSWFDQPGFPMITVRQKCVDGKLRMDLSQEAFASPRERMRSLDTRWQIPLALRVSTGDGSSEIQWRLMDGPTAHFEFDSCDWVYPNADLVGYYHMKLEGAARDALQAAHTNGLNVRERAGLLYDLGVLVNVGAASITDYFELAEQFRSERSRHVLQALFSGFGFMGPSLDSEEAREAFFLHRASFSMPVFEELGWEVRPGEDPQDTELRASMLWKLNSKYNPTMLEEALQRVKAYLADMEVAPIHPSLLGVLLRMAALVGDETLFDQYLHKYRSVETPMDQQLYLLALTRFLRRDLHERARDFVLSDEVPEMRRGWMLNAALGVREYRDDSWAWIKGNWDQITGRLTPESQEALLYFGYQFCDVEHRQEAVDFFGTKVQTMEKVTQTYEKMLEQIDTCIDVRSRLEEPLTKWLEEHYPEPFQVGQK